MKVNVIKIPSRYEILEIENDLSGVMDFLSRRGIKCNIDMDDIGTFIDIHDYLLRPGMIMILYKDNIIDVEYNDYSSDIIKLLNNLTKFK